MRRVTCIAYLPHSDGRGFGLYATGLRGQWELSIFKRFWTSTTPAAPSAMPPAALI